MKIKEFFDQEFKDFSNLDNVRSIPSLVDGLKDSQRKAVYGVFCNGNSETKVAQLSGICALASHYNHGESSMADTIVGLAQDFPGSNNVNLFEPIGQFGSILSSSSAAHRYIYTKPSSNLRKYIRKEDDCILEHRYEDNDKAEPLLYYPVAPFWVLNGAVGIGTGHSCNILPRNPANVLKAIELIVKGKPRVDVEKLLIPSYNGWKGTITDNDGQFIIKGVLQKVNTTTIRVVELPPQYGVDKFKSILVELMDKGKVKDFDNNSTESSFDFTITVPREVGKSEQEKLENLFKMSVRKSENITLWDSNGNLKRYDSAYDALVEFVEFRLGIYQKRKETQLQIMSDEIDLMRNKALFIENWNDCDTINKMTISEVEEYQKMGGVKEEYLPNFLAMRLTTLTKEMIDSLMGEIEVLKAKSEDLQSKTNVDLYQTDIKETLK